MPRWPPNPTVWMSAGGPMAPPRWPSWAGMRRVCGTACRTFRQLVRHSGPAVPVVQHRGCPRAAGARILPGRDPRAGAHARVAEGSGRCPGAAQVQPAAAVRGAHVPFRRAEPGLARHGARSAPTISSNWTNTARRPASNWCRPSPPSGISTWRCARTATRGSANSRTGGASVQPHRTDGASYAQSADDESLALAKRLIDQYAPLFRRGGSTSAPTRPSTWARAARRRRPALWASARCTPDT